jgi:hypothetical protein
MEYFLNWFFIGIFFFGLLYNILNYSNLTIYNLNQETIHYIENENQNNSFPLDDYDKVNDSENFYMDDMNQNYNKDEIIFK